MLLFTLTACPPETKPAGDDTAGVTETDTDTDADADTDADTDTDTDTDCTAGIASISPDDGATGVTLDAAILATYEGVVSSADITMDVAGTFSLAEDGLSGIFTPDAPFDRSTTYSFTATACDDEVSGSFTTVGEATTVDLTGRTYDIELDAADAEWVKPGAGSILASQLQTNSILLMVEDAAEDLEVLGAAGYSEPVEQFPCTYAIDFPSSDFSSNPAFSLGPLDAEMDAGGAAFDLYELAVTGVFADDGESMENVVLVGLIDTQPISEAYDIDICDLVEGFGDACIACPDGHEGCLEIEVHDPSAPWREDLSLDAGVDPSSDRNCL